MVFIETPQFTSDLVELLSDEEYNKLQILLIERPDAGVVIPGTGGVRKIRIGLQGRGKRGGARVIYYWQVSQHHIYMFLIYAKNIQADMTTAQKAAFRSVVKELD